MVSNKISYPDLTILTPYCLPKAEGSEMLQDKFHLITHFFWDLGTQKYLSFAWSELSSAKLKEADAQDICNKKCLSSNTKVDFSFGILVSKLS